MFAQKNSPKAFQHHKSVPDGLREFLGSTPGDEPELGGDQTDLAGQQEDTVDLGRGGKNDPAMEEK